MLGPREVKREKRELEVVEVLLQWDELRSWLERWVMM
jgi:hypothetical protein